jgi:membrane protease YdiL (CAAX protease family)
MTLTLLTAFGFPLITAVGYTVLLLVYRARYGAQQANARLAVQGFYLYPVFLAVPALAALSEPAARHAIGQQFALVNGSAPLTSLAVVLALAAGVGWFFLESRATRPAALEDTDPRTRMVEGHTDDWRSFNPRPITYVALAVLVVLAEEIIWRGVLIHGMIAHAGWAVVPAVALSSISFGLNHYYFGLRNIVLKTAFGAVLGALLLISGSLATPIAAHLAFEVLVGLQLLGAHPAVAEVSHAAP